MKANERGIAERTKHGRRLSLMAKLGGGTALLALLLVAVTAGSAVVIFSNYLDRDAREKSEAAVRGLESILEAKREETRVVSLFLARYGNIVEDVAAGNADALLQKLTPMWKESDLDFVTVLDAKGNVVVPSTMVWPALVMMEMSPLPWSTYWMSTMEASSRTLTSRRS